MIGWPELVDTVAAVYRALPPGEQAGAVIFGNNYGRTGAVALFRHGLGLPYPISRHGDFICGGRASGAPTWSSSWAGRSSAGSSTGTR